MDITLTLNTRDFAPRVVSYEIKKVLEQGRVVKTLDKTEHTPTAVTRDVITFSLFPQTDANATADYNKLKDMQFSATYTDPYSNADVTKTVRVTSDLNAVFGIKSADGNRYYKGGAITLRAVTANA